VQLLYQDLNIMNLPLNYGFSQCYSTRILNAKLSLCYFTQLSTMSFQASELEIAVNYPVHTWTGNGSFAWNLTSWSVSCPPDWAQGPSLLRVERIYRCLVVSQLYPSCGFSSAVCLIHVSNPCRQIQLTAFVHHTLLTSRFKKNQNRILLWNFHDFV